MSVAIMTATRCLAVAAVAGLGIAAPDGGGARASVVVGNYFQDFVQQECDNAAACVLSFGTIPAGQRVLITHVGCQITSAANVRSTSLVLYSGGLEVPNREDYIPLFPGAASPTQKNVTAAGDTAVLASPSMKPTIRVFLDASATSFVLCDITGQRPSPI